MNSGQMLMALGAVMLIGLVVLRNSNVNMYSTEMVTESKIRILMTDFAQSVVEDVSSRRFGEATVNNTVTNTSQLDAASALKWDAGETSNNIRLFDDYDDFNRSSTGGFVQDTVYNQIPLRVKTRVYYVNPANPSLSLSSSPTWYKKLDVTVTVIPGSYEYMSGDTIKMSRIFSFFQFGIR